MKLNYLLWLFTLVYGAAGSPSKLETLYEWKYVNITPVPPHYHVVGSYHDGIYYIQKKVSSVKRPYFNYKLAIPFDIDKSIDGRVFVTIVGRNGVNVSLTTVTNISADNGPLLTPYPDHSWFLDKTDCSKLTNARGITIDKCNRLWVLDDGQVDKMDLCPAKLLVFDLESDTLLDTYEIPSNVSRYKEGRGSVLVNPVVNTEGSTCEKLTVYIADPEGYALIIWDGNEFIRITGPEFNPVESSIRFTISDESYNLHGGIAPMDFEYGADHLLFAPLSSRHLFAFNTTKLSKVFYGECKPFVLGTYNILRTQPTSLRFSSNSRVLFIGQTDNSIDCHPRTELLHPENIVTLVTDDQRLQYISSIKTFNSSSRAIEDELYVLSNRLQKVIRRTRNLDEVNFRILKGNVKNLIKNTICDVL